MVSKTLLASLTSSGQLRAVSTTVLLKGMTRKGPAAFMGRADPMAVSASSTLKEYAATQRFVEQQVCCVPMSCIHTSETGFFFSFATLYRPFWFVCCRHRRYVLSPRAARPAVLRRQGRSRWWYLGEFPVVFASVCQCAKHRRITTDRMTFFSTANRGRLKKIISYGTVLVFKVHRMHRSIADKSHIQSMKSNVWASCNEPTPTPH